MRLTGPNVAKLTLPADRAEAIVFDDALPGFGIRLRAGGKRVWVAQYRLGAKQRRVTIGNVEAIGADKARILAKEILAKAQLGTDAQTEKQDNRKRAAITFGSVVTNYLAAAQGRLKPRSYEEVERHFRQHWKPFRELPIHQIDRASVATRLKAISTENGPFAANRARASLSALFGWAMREGIAEGNPVIGTNKATDEVSRDRVLSDAELALIWRFAGDGDYGRIIRLLILTGQRREEVGGVMRSEVQVAKALWSLPRERTKNGLPHDVPLSAAALSIISSVPTQADRDYIFGSGAGAFSGWSKSKIALDGRLTAEMTREAKAASEKPKPMPSWRLHDIRRTVATRMADLGVLPHVVEAILNHVSGHRAGVAGVYNRANYATEKRAALDLWAEHVTTLANSDEGSGK